jgi:hypothetical protein
MRSRASWLSAIALAACSSKAPPAPKVAPKPPPPPVCSEGWCWLHPRPQGNRLEAIAPYREGAVAVGELGAIVELKDGEARGVSSPTTRDLRDVWIAADGTFGLAAGSNVVLQRIDGQWSVFEPATSQIAKTEDPIFAEVIWAKTSTAIYIGDHRGAILSFDGELWRRTRLPGFTKISAFGIIDRSVAVVAENGIYREKDDGSWSALDPVNDRLYALAIAPERLIASENRAIVERTKHGWRTLVPETNQSLVSASIAAGGEILVASTMGDILRVERGALREVVRTPVHLGDFRGGWLAGEGGFVGRLAGQMLEVLAAPSPRSFGAVWGKSARRLFLLANDGRSAPSERLLRLEDGALRNDGLDDVYYFGLHGFAEDDVIAVGSGGRIARFDGARWKVEPSGVSEGLAAVWGPARNDVFAVGERGTILHFDGKSWTPQSSGEEVTLFDVFGLGPADVFAVGEAGVILHYDGTRWSNQRAPDRGALRTVHAASANEAYAAC